MALVESSRGRYSPLRPFTSSKGESYMAIGHRLGLIPPRTSPEGVKPGVQNDPTLDPEVPGDMIPPIYFLACAS